MIIAIDGIAGSGKGTLAKGLAQHYGYQFLPTGNLYRCVAKKLIQKSAATNIDIDSLLTEETIADIVQRIDNVEIFATDIGGDIISDVASRIAKLSMVRKHLNKFQRDWISSNKNAIVEGRDIGTIICPEADVKIFLTADLSTRATRRMKQLKESGINEPFEEIYTNLASRDERDINRENAPLKKAEDAVLLDSSNLEIEEVQKKAIEIIESRKKN